MIRIENVSKKLGSFHLKDIDFTIPKGYICGLIGENGAGKTSLINLILGLYQADSGNILIDNTDIADDEVTAKNKLGYVLSEDLFDSHLSLINNADAYGKFYSDYDRDVFLSYCKRFGLDYNKKLKKHSKGEKLKFQFAFALSHNPELLVLDEPTANFDPEFRKEFFKVLSEFIEDGTRSIILVTHLTSDLDKIADYIAFIHKGKLLFSYDREQLENSFRIVSGEDYKINLIPKEKIIHKEASTYSSKALVHHNYYSQYDKEVTVTVPTVEELMYFLIKKK